MAIGDGYEWVCSNAPMPPQPSSARTAVIAHAGCRLSSPIGRHPLRQGLDLRRLRPDWLLQARVTSGGKERDARSSPPAATDPIARWPREVKSVKASIVLDDEKSEAEMTRQTWLKLLTWRNFAAYYSRSCRRLEIDGIKGFRTDVICCSK